VLKLKARRHQIENNLYRRDEAEEADCRGCPLREQCLHTPGHVSIRISSRGEDAVITGDLMHHPCQFKRLEWASSFDADQAAAIATRKAFLERYADQPVPVIGTHFALPTAGKIRRDGEVYRFEV